jgi:hypothetical protein
MFPKYLDAVKLKHLLDTIYSNQPKQIRSDANNDSTSYEIVAIDNAKHDEMVSIGGYLLATDVKRHVADKDVASDDGGNDLAMTHVDDSPINAHGDATTIQPRVRSIQHAANAKISKASNGDTRASIEGKLPASTWPPIPNGGGLKDSALHIAGKIKRIMNFLHNKITKAKVSTNVQNVDIVVPLTTHPIDTQTPTRSSMEYSMMYIFEIFGLLFKHIDDPKKCALHIDAIDQHVNSDTFQQYATASTFRGIDSDSDLDTDKKRSCMSLAYTTFQHM